MDEFGNAVNRDFPDDDPATTEIDLDSDDNDRPDWWIRIGLALNAVLLMALVLAILRVGDKFDAVRQELVQLRKVAEFFCGGEK